MAKDAEMLRFIIDPDDASFNKAGNLPKRIADYCERTGQGRPETVGQIMRCIYESLCLKYRFTAEKLEELCSKTYSSINIVGGGTKEKLLCQYVADCTGKKVSAGPVEATAIGNISMQLIAAGEIPDVMTARGIIRKSFDVENYVPTADKKAKWDEAYNRFCEMIG